MSATMPEPAQPFDDLAQQHEAAQLGMWAFLATEILFFGVLFTGYTVMRVLWPDAFVAGSRHTDLPLGAIETGVLLTSSFTAAWALQAVKRSRPREAGWLLLFTATMGVAFLGIHGAEYRHDDLAGVIPGIRYDEVGDDAPHEALFFVLYYVTTGFHALHVLIGVGLLCVLARLAFRGDFLPGNHAPLEVGTLYWHLVDIVWIFVFPLYYQVGRA
ncbi:cytochrome c oxidase subunit 3 family protein [Luteibacter aegosomatis]|uniref:cytochrome c oxidase subunit 3 family protein n=1 Tax=Luteibacter aegosomatis TaxID=2911537 RepID=UPI001FF9D609|nr:cytochrome c oxidase subunit 3 family protein [Luteibacter aegosomatis]UPG87675.1 cytochrome c oxidase subunit 3 family protein [Luteibacter aegosomatis]